MQKAPPIGEQSIDGRALDWPSYRQAANFTFLLRSWIANSGQLLIKFLWACAGRVVNDMWDLGSASNTTYPLLVPPLWTSGMVAFRWPEDLLIPACSPALTCALPELIGPFGILHLTSAACQPN